MKRLDAKGFGVIEGLLILVIVGIIGGAGYMVYKAQKGTNKSLDVAGNSEIVKPVQKAKETVPDGFVEYLNKEFNLKFAYPKEWGNVIVEKATSQEGEGYNLNFSKNVFAKDDYVRIILETPAYKAFGEGFQIGFTDYKMQEDSILSQDKQRKSGSKNYATTILETTDNHMLYAGYDCLNGGTYTVGMSKLNSSKFAGFGIGYFKSFTSDDMVGYCDNPPKVPVSDSVDKNVQKQLTTILESVKNL